LPESADPRTVEAAWRLTQSGCVRDIVLFGRSEVKATCQQLGLDFARLATGVRFAEEAFQDLSEQAVQHLQHKLAAKGKTISPAELSAQAENRLLLAGELLHQGEVDAVVAGAVASTAAVIRAAISSVGLAEGCRTVSGSFILHKDQPTPGQPPVMIFADAGVVIEPTEHQLVDIAASTAQTWDRLLAAQHGPARVAFLSFSTHGSAEHPAAARMASAHRQFQTRFPEISSDGELQFDAAIVPEVAQRKCANSPIAGRANCFIFPDLNAGNLAYKIAQRLGGYAAFGPILQGLRRPYSDLSRGANAAEIYASCLVNMLRA
jgi:phosphate acetyltransferase